MSAPQPPRPGEEDDQRAARRRKLEALRAAGRDPFAHERFERSHSAAQAADIAAPHWRVPEEERTAIATSGRITAIRSKGGAAFADIRDGSGRVQLFAQKNVLGEEAFAEFTDLDLGDIVGVTGIPFYTRSGEPSLNVRHCTLLAKALRGVPMGKEDAEGVIHGAIADRDDRYRHRYLDLIANPPARDVLIKRSQVVSALRRFLDNRGYLEVETPMLQDVAGGASARPFTTHHNALDVDFKLRISLELYLKRLIVGGIERVYEIGKIFRNEGISTRHSPEFTMIELYQAWANLEDVMDLVEAMWIAVAREVNGSTVLRFGDESIDLAGVPWARLPMLEGIERHAGIAPVELTSLEAGQAACRRIRTEFDPDRETTLGGLIEKLHERYTQPHLIAPTFVTDFPIETSPLAKKRADNAALTRRFEVYIGRQELGNAFSEINDPDDQRARFEAQVRQHAAGDAEAHPMDEEYVQALEYGMPPTGGLGIGIDRMVMVLTGADAIRDVILFPLLRPKG